MKILAFDTETGSLYPSEGSLLTAHFAILDENLEVVDSLSLKTKPDDNLIKANPGALAVNKIDIEKHKAEALTYSEAKIQLTKFLAKHSSKYNELTPMAHNISFDLDFINTHLMPLEEWNKYVSYHKLDTVGLAVFFKLCKWIPSKQSVSLGKLADFFELKFEGDAHTAQADVGVMVKVLKEFVAPFKETTQK
jgi:DNA polymerase III alpha subunit (gram-positive type)